MKLQCIAIDDEPFALQLLQKYVSQIPYLEMKETFTDAISALCYLEKNQVDLLFLDIQMPDISGLQLAKVLRPRNPAIIFTTAYSNYAVEGFNLEAVDYLLKPFDFKRFENAVKKAADYYDFIHIKEQKELQYFFVKSEYQTIKVNFDSILYIEGLGDYCKIFVEGSKPILTLLPMKSLYSQLPEVQFMRVHRSYIVPKKHIKSIRNKKIDIGIIEVPVGITYMKAINDFFENKKAEQ